MTCDDPIRLAVVQLKGAFQGFWPGDGNVWLPDFPLILEPDSATSEMISQYEEAAGTIEGALRKWQDESRRRRQSLLRSVLEYLERMKVDLAVFPEYSLSPEDVSILQQFQSISVFAGIGILLGSTESESSEGRATNYREIFANCELAEGIIADEKSLDQLEGCNAAVFKDWTGKLLLVTKKNAAPQEKMTEGMGVRPYTWQPKRETTMNKWKLSLSICRDFLPDGNREVADIRCVCAATPRHTIDEFLERRHGGTPVLFASHALYGGSSIDVDCLDAQAFQERNHATPLPADAEGIIIVDYWGEQPDKEQDAPSVPYPKLIGRTPIIYTNKQNRQSLSSNAEATIVEQWEEWSKQNIKDFRIVEDQIGDQVLNMDQSWLSPIVKERITLLSNPTKRPRLNHGEEDRLIALSLICSSLTLDYDYRWEGLLRRFAIEVVNTLANNAANAAAEDESRGSAAATALPQARTVRAMLTQRVSPEEQSIKWPPFSDIIKHLTKYTSGSAPEEDSWIESDSMQVLRRWRLTSFADKSTKSALTGMYEFLTLFSSLTDQAELRLRIYTERNIGEMSPFFEAILSVSRMMNKEDSEDLNQSIGQLLAMALRSGWNLVPQELQEKIRPPEHRKVTIPVNKVPSIWDWDASVTDLIRTFDDELCIDLLVSPGGSFSDSQQICKSPESDSVGGTKWSRQVAHILTAMNDAEQRNLPSHGLCTSLEISATRSSTNIPDLLVEAIARKTLGPGLWLESLPDMNSAKPALLTPSQTIRVAHPPMGRSENRGLHGSDAFELAMDTVPMNSGGVRLGTAMAHTATEDREVEPTLSDEVRTRHLYVIGRTGSGKTNLLKYLAQQDIEAGRGIAVFDPHGDLVNYLLCHVGDRAKDVLYLNFDKESSNLPVINPLDLDVKDSDRLLAIDSFVELMTKQSFHEWYGPRFTSLIQRTLRSMMSPGYGLRPTIAEIAPLLSEREHRRWLSLVSGDPSLQQGWELFEDQGDKEKAELLDWALSKFSGMGPKDILGQVFGGGKSQFSLDTYVKEHRIILIRIPQKAMSQASTRLLGSFLHERIRQTLFSEADENGSVSKDNIIPFSIYIDEFQTFGTLGFSETLAEARKYGLSLVLANQNLKQLDAFNQNTGTATSELRHAVLGNAESFAIFGSSPDDNALFEEMLGLDKSTIKRLPQFVPLVQTMVDNHFDHFTVHVPKASDDSGDSRIVDEIRQRMVDEHILVPRKTLEKRLRKRAEKINGQTRRMVQHIDTQKINTAQQSVRATGGSIAGQPPQSLDFDDNFIDEWKTKAKRINDSAQADKNSPEESRDESTPSVSAIPGPEDQMNSTESTTSEIDSRDPS